MMGHIAEWYYNGIAGIRPQKPGFSEVLVKPYLPESINDFCCTCHSASGDITVHLKRENGTPVLTCHADDRIRLHIDESQLHT